MALGSHRMSIAVQTTTHPAHTTARTSITSTTTTSSLPGGATVKGIEVRLDAFVDSVGSNAPKMCVQLSWNGGSNLDNSQANPHADHL